MVGHCVLEGKDKPSAAVAIAGGALDNTELGKMRLQTENMMMQRKQGKEDRRHQEEMPVEEEKTTL